jgi:hypothetical protein
MPRGERDRIERLDELHWFLHQSHISGKNLKRLNALPCHANREVAAVAALVRDIGRSFPGKHNRWLKMARRRADLFERALEIFGLEFFEDLLAGYGDFESPLWEFLEQYRIAPPWTKRSCDCGSGRSYRDCCLDRENQMWERPEPEAFC